MIPEACVWLSGTGPDVSAINMLRLIGQPETEADNDTVVKGSAWNLTNRVSVGSCFGLGRLAIVESMGKLGYDASAGAENYYTMIMMSPFPRQQTCWKAVSIKLVQSTRRKDYAQC